MNRRNLLQLLTSGAIATVAGHAEPSADVKRFIVTPQMFGAKADGKALDTSAINFAIQKLHRDGGGTIYFAPGTYLCGTIVVPSIISIYIEAGAVLLGSTDVAA